MSEIRVNNLRYFNKPDLRRCNMIRLDMNIIDVDLEDIDLDFEKKDETNYNLVFKNKQTSIVVNLSEDDMKQIGMFVLCNIFSQTDVEEDERYVKVSIRQKKY